MTTGRIADGRLALDVLRALPAAEAGDVAARQVVAGWPGWGPVAPAFDPYPRDEWKPVSDDLFDLLSGSELRTAREAVDTAFYTPAWLVRQVWQMVEQAGFVGGRVLIPGLGAGRFVEYAPAGLRGRCQFVGVEVDVLTCRVAKALHPDVDVIAQPMEKTSLVRDSFDLAIGNVPFANTSVNDGAHQLPLHLYMLTRAAEAVRPGGYVACLTSRYTMDSHRLLPASAGVDLVGAVRLPSGAFAESGTDVVADLVLYRKRLPGERPAARRIPNLQLPFGPAWANKHVPVSGWWGEHPELVVGRMETTGFDKAPLRVVCDGDVQLAVKVACDHLAGMLVPYGADGVDLASRFADVTLVDADGRKEGSFHCDGATVVRIVGGRPQPVNRPSDELRALIGLRDLTVDLVAAEADHTTPDAAIEPLRARLASAYTAYTAKWGPLNRGQLVAGKADPDTGLPQWSWKRPTLGGFRGDPDAALVWALEVYQQDGGTAEPSAILQRRVNRPYQPPVTADSPDDALTISLSETGTVNLPRIGGLLGCTPEQAIAVLGDRIMRDPATGDWLRAVDYLWGDITGKLAVAQTAAATDPTYARNVDALVAIQPAPLGPEHIRVALGAPWVPVDVVEQFATDVLGAPVNIDHSPATATWDLPRYTPSRHSAPQAHTTYGTQHIDGYALLKLALNGKTASIETNQECPDGRWRLQKDPDATMAANAKLDLLKERFTTWVWEDPTRTRRLVDVYNRLFNSHRPRQADGSHIRLPGLAPHITPWPWQLDAIDQIMSTPATMCGLPVGSGKTLTLVGAAMMLKRLGRSTKTLAIVPNHLLEQTVREAVQAFPTGRFLAASREDLAGENRRVFAARCALGDWDVVLMTHESFRSIPVDPFDEIDWLERQKDDYADALRLTEGHGFAAKEIARRLRSLDNKLDALRSRRGDPNTVTWDQLGITAVHVDEAVAFKRLPAPCHTDGFNPGSSARALDLKMKIDLLRQADPHRPHVAFYTGTPFTNTILEAWVWQTYLQPQRLAQAGVASLDAWIANFVTMATRVEPSPEGASLRVITRPYEYRNVADLMAMFAEVAILADASMLPLRRPDRADHTVQVSRTTQQAAYVAQLAVRADRIRNGGVTDDNMLVVCNNGRAVALDPHLVGVGGGSPKLAAVIAQVADCYHAHTDDPITGSPNPGALHLLFCDWGVPKLGDASSYGTLRAGLIAAGVPADRIRWVHEATDSKAKEALFAACREGRVSVLIASTDKAGLGTNIQTRLRTIHHVDAPWRPADMEQRDGRALRPGNTYPLVDVYRYVVTGSFDAYTYAALARKAHIPAQLIKAATDPTIRDIEEIGDVEISYGQIAAAASGNPRLLERATLAADVRRLRLLRSVSLQEVATARQVITETERRIDTLQAHLKVLQAATDTVADTGDLDTLTGVVGQMVAAAMRRDPYAHRASGRWRGLPIEFQPILNHDWRVRRVEEITLRVTINHHPVTVDSWRRSWWRNNPAAPALIGAALDQWIDRLPHLIADTNHELAEVRRGQAAAQQVLADWTSPHDAPLASAEARLARLDAILAAEADDPKLARAS